jgi:FtsZ-interacting cell division protein ZipA
MSSTTWIVIAIAIAVLLIAALVVATNTARNRRRHRQAEDIREQAKLDSAKLERREALAQETAAKARAAQAEAEVKAAEAARLSEHAAQHQSDAAASREQLQERWDHADRIDPKTGKQDRDADEPVSDRSEAWSAESAQAPTDAQAVRQETYRGTPR